MMRYFYFVYKGKIAISQRIKLIKVEIISR